MTYLEKFGQKRRVFPVIHVVSKKQCLDNIKICVEAKTDGVFLINHHSYCNELLDIYKYARELYPNLWIGLNCLDLAPWQAIENMPEDVNGLWSDNAYINENKSQQPYAEETLNVTKQKNWKGLHFGGVAFKYQRYVEELEKAVEIAKNYVDVITTSGDGTGIAADIIKIERMYYAAKGFPLAIASGITPENIELYLPISNAYLVATGISKDFTTLDPVRTKELINIVHDYNRNL